MPRLENGTETCDKCNNAYVPLPGKSGCKCVVEKPEKELPPDKMTAEAFKYKKRAGEAERVVGLMTKALTELLRLTPDQCFMCTQCDTMEDDNHFCWKDLDGENPFNELDEACEENFEMSDWYLSKVGIARQALKQAGVK
jgi:hypothetical protein